MQPGTDAAAGRVAPWVAKATPAAVASSAAPMATRRTEFEFISRLPSGIRSVSDVVRNVYRIEKTAIGKCTYLSHSWHERVTEPRSSTVPKVLVVAATPLELSFVARANTLCCGVGPVEAAAATARTLERDRPEAVLHIGLAGARALLPGSLVLGSEAIYCDLVDGTRSFPRIERAAPDPDLLTGARNALPEAAVLAIATSARVGGGHACCDVEAMEGFAVLRSAALAGVPALELRAVSNTFDAARADWRIDEAIEALAVAVEALLGVFDA